jgi:hypothetical protein
MIVIVRRNRGQSRERPDFIPVLASHCGGSFNLEATPTAQHADTVAVGSGLNDSMTVSLPEFGSEE